MAKDCGEEVMSNPVELLAQKMDRQGEHLIATILRNLDAKNDALVAQIEQLEAEKEALVAQLEAINTAAKGVKDYYDSPNLTGERTLLDAHRKIINALNESQSTPMAAIQVKAVRQFVAEQIQMLREAPQGSSKEKMMAYNLAAVIEDESRKFCEKLREQGKAQCQS